MLRTTRVAIAIAASMLVCGVVQAGSSTFWNFESPQVHPLEITPDGTRLLAVNTADGRLEIFDVVGRTLVPAGSVPVGLEPVSVRAHGNDEAWVVNLVSDSISIVDLATARVTATITTADLPDGLGDEPCDVVFAGLPERAFVTISQENRVKVYDPANLAAAPVVLDIAGEDRRALATDGTTVWVAVCESGNGTTILSEDVVSSAVNPYPGDPNPPPNSGTGFDPPMNGSLPPAPEASLIVRKDDAGVWRDVNGADWSAAVTWDLHDHDLAVIDANTLAVSYVPRLMTMNMALDARPGGGVLLVGTEAINEVRFEPILNGIFSVVRGAMVDGGGGVTLADLNPHLDYTTSSVPQPVRDLSVGDPRGVAWNDAGDRVWVTGMGSNNLVALDASLARVGLVEVGEGPTGVAVHAGADVVFTLNRFEGSISIVDATAMTELDRVTYFDPTPVTIRTGRPLLYDTHVTSGLGHVSCATCHVDGRMDQVAWDLGNPAGQMQAFHEDCLVNGQCTAWHPVKGPMLTQTLIGIGDTAPLHWRGDRADLAAFNRAYMSINGDDAIPSAEHMQAFTDFAATFRHPPNPYRTLDNELATALPNGGNAVQGKDLYVFGGFTGGATCTSCHGVNSGSIPQIAGAPQLQANQQMNVPQLRNIYDRVGFDMTSAASNKGFGFMHDGHADSVVTFLDGSRFNFPPGATGVQNRRDIEAYLWSFAVDTHAIIGVQVTVPAAPSAEATLRDALLAYLAGISPFEVQVVVHGMRDGIARGWTYDAGAGVFQSDRVGETHTLAEMDAATATGSELTYTFVPTETATRIALDRDEDGFFNRDELDACADPADGASTPADGCCSDTNGDGVVNVDDLVNIITSWGTADPAADVDGSGLVDVDDLVAVITDWGAC